MPSKHQTGANSKDYESEPKKMLATKNDLTIAALIRGIRKPERAKAYIDAEVALADDEDRDVRKGIIGACNRKQTALEDGDTVDTPVDVDTTDAPGQDEDDDTPPHDRQDDANGDGDDVGKGETVAVDDGDDPYPGVERFEDDDALADAIDDHEHGDVFTMAKPAGKLAGCFECESNIGIVPR